MGYRILTLNNISVRGLERLPRDRYEVASQIGEPHAVLLRSAVLASSPHNTQPWRFRVGESFVELFLDPRRSVVGLDPFLREAYIGMGCALENLLLAAGAQGLAERATVPDGHLALRPVEPLRMVARVDLAPATGKRFIQGDSESAYKSGHV